MAGVLKSSGPVFTYYLVTVKGPLSASRGRIKYETGGHGAAWITFVFVPLRVNTFQWRICFFTKIYQFLFMHLKGELKGVKSHLYTGW